MVTLTGHKHPCHTRAFHSSVTGSTEGSTAMGVGHYNVWNIACVEGWMRNLKHLRNSRQRLPK